MKKPLLAVLFLAFCGSSLAGAAVVPTVKTASVESLGKVVVSATGRTLYHYTDESKGKVDCTGACAKLWPPLVVGAAAKPVAGPGITASKLGVLKRPDGKMQVTYGGLGLYLYAGDKKAGDANGQALESSWYAVSPTAKVVKASAAPASSSSSSGGGGYGSSGYTSTTPGYDPGY
jgi:predicted lipoprotein with Yx(FWY)xxD motif